MPAFLHVLKRLALVVAGYGVSLLTGLLAVAGLCGALSWLPHSPGYFDAVAISPIMALAVPAIGLFVLLLAVLLTFAQMLVAALISELFSLRGFWVHAVFGALVGISGFVMVMPTPLDRISRSDIADIAIVAAAGLVAGIVYWLIAGRQAGFRRDWRTDPA